MLTPHSLKTLNATRQSTVRHEFLMGKSGQGKTEAILSGIAQQISCGGGLLFVDPKSTKETTRVDLLSQALDFGMGFLSSTPLLRRSFGGSIVAHGGSIAGRSGSIAGRSGSMVARSSSIAARSGSIAGRSGSMVGRSGSMVVLHCVVMVLRWILSDKSTIPMLVPIAQPRARQDAQRTVRARCQA